MAAVAGSSSSTRVPIRLSPQALTQHTHSGRAAAYHVIHHDSKVELGGATLRISGNNGSAGATFSLAAANGVKLDGRADAADGHDYVLIYDDASRSYILHKVSSVSRIIGSSSGTGTKAETTNARSKSENKTSDATYSPALARTPQSTNSPSASSAPHRSVSQSRAERTATQHPAKTAAIGSGTAKKISSHSKKNDYNSSPTPSVGAGTPAAYGLGISTSTSKESPSFKQHGYASNASKGKTPAHDVEEFDMGSNSDEDLLSNSLQLPPSRTSIMANSSRSQSTHASTGLQGHAGQGQPTRQPGPASGSTSLSMFSNQDMVMSEISSEDENDFDDLANDLESSLVGQGPFARASISNFGGGGANRDIVSSDEDEDEEEDEDFENALSEQTKVPAPQPQMSRPTIQSIPPIQQPQPHVQQPLPHRIGQIPQQPAARPVQAGKKLPSAPRRYDSDIASSSESDDDSD